MTAPTSLASISDVTARIAQIQAQLATFAPPAATASMGSAGSTGSADFAQQLDGALTQPAGTSTTGSPTGADVVADAKRYLGVPYRWGGTDPSTGLDCSGLVQHVYGDLGITLPRVSGDQARVGQKVDSLADAQPGDILAFGSPVHHVAIYIGNGQMIQAPHTGEDVQISNVADFGEPVAAIRRVLPSASTSSASSTPSADMTSSGSIDPDTPYAATFEAAADRTGVPVSLLTAVAQEESGFHADAVSGAGAEGIMQLMPGTAKSLGVSNPLDPTQSINGGADYLKTLLDEFGSTTLALAAYNAGPGAVLKYGGVPPYAETRRYVSNVLSLMGSS